jgi:serine/threonine-protein kinase
MGVVYKAQQISLNRPVALKFLPPELIDSREWKERFSREAQAAAALAHPNICTIHEIDEVDDKVFIAMEYLEGQSLADKIESKPLDIVEAINIALRVADGLKHAHKRGIIHRDIKPDNIMITEDGQAKIMDFGLAKLTGKTRLTKTATVMGTIAYMSPEQARGDKDIGQKTDIWSLGVVLYEILTGRLPFDAETDTGLIYKIINEGPEPALQHRSDIPGSLVSIIEKAIQKNPQSRHEDAEAFIAALEVAMSEISSLSGRSSPSIAVLPFVNMSADPEQEYFCDGLAEELINALTQIRDLKVIARTSAFSFKGRNVNVRDIGRELNVETILEGSVRKAGNRLRITAQLVTVAQGHHLWSERYDREMEDVFAIQDEITDAIVEKLKPKLLQEEKPKIATRQTVDIEAYNLYLKGRWFWNKRTDEDLRRALDYFSQAIEADPNYAPAYAGIADTHATRTAVTLAYPEQEFPKAREAAIKALEINDKLAEAHTSLGVVKSTYEWDWKGAEADYRRALELNPGYAMGHALYAVYLVRTERFNEAIERIQQAWTLDPLSLYINFFMGMIFFYAGREDKAIEILSRAIELDPRVTLAHAIRGMCYGGKSMFEEAMADFEKEREISGDFSTAVDVAIGITYALTGNTGEARKVLANLLERSRHAYVQPFGIAMLYFALHDNDRGFEFLGKAYKTRDSGLAFIRVTSVFDIFHLRSDPRYTSIVKRMNFDT